MAEALGDDDGGSNSTDDLWSDPAGEAGGVPGVVNTVVQALGGDDGGSNSKGDLWSDTGEAVLCASNVWQSEVNAETNEEELHDTLDEEVFLSVLVSVIFGDFFFDSFLFSALRLLVSVLSLVILSKRFSIF